MNAGWRKNFSESRIVSAIELLIGSFIVIGHNVFRIVPNEVIVLFVLGMLSFWIRNGGLSVIGLKRPSSWTRIILIALAAVTLRNVVGEYVILPLAEQFWPNPQLLPEEAEKITGSIKYALLALLLVWTFAAFGEEFAYRGYLLTRAADLGNRSTTAYLIGVVYVSVLFGYGHYWKGPAGMIDSGFAGLILGTAYLLSGRNLWTTILAHGLNDTFAVILVFFGWTD